MVIQHNIAAINSYRNLGTNQSALNKNLEKLSSGYKINRAGDNAAGLAISESMRSQINGLNQAAANANDAIGLIQTAEGALTEVHSMLQRMTTLATQAANGTYNSVARGNIQSEMNELMAEIDRVANNTDFNGIKPLEDKNGYDAATRAGNNGSHKMTFQIGPTAGETILVSGQDMTISGIFGATRPSYAKNPSNGNKSMTGKVVDENHILYVGKDTTTYANRAITAIKSAIDTVSSYRAKLGAAQNRLEHTISNLEVTSENITAAESRIRDTDMADEITNYTKNNILLQAAQSMLSQANAAPQGVLSLLQ
ncbi:flagellin [Enterocloster bolteae]|uniref:flagellin N-terminal helical domain-containing protein n=1 Tax=Enterocloster bolteae TaxID=208479 RepID=UPI002A804C95|nr:flagellin [Enterocloster bolteae]